MPRDGYLIPGARGLVAVRAERDVTPEAVAAAINDFGVRFNKWKADYESDRDGRNADIATLQASVTELEQRLATGDAAFLTGHGNGAGRSPGAVLAQKLIGDASFQGVLDKKSTKTALDVDAGMLLGPVEANTITGGTGGSDYFNTKETQPGIVGGVQRRRWLRQRFPVLRTTGGSVEYHRELSFTNNAAPQGSGSPFVEQGSTKAESVITYEAVEEKIPTIAHFVKASKQILADVAALGLTLDNKLRYGLELAIESQIITGQGTGANMSGFTKSGNFTAFTPTSGETALDSLNRSLAAIEAADGTPDLIVMHPNDFRSMQRVKATGGSEEYLYGSPSGANSANVWNTEIHTTPAMTQGKFITMDTIQAAVMYERESATVATGWVDDDFTRNLLTLLAEARLTIAVQRPSMVRFGSLTL